jgi:hypothetical protein
LCPLGDVLVLHLSGLLAHPRFLLPSTGFFYPEEALCNPWLNVSHRGDLSPYSPKCVEGEFYELSLYGVLGSCASSLYPFILSSLCNIRRD